jgi:spore maturation protein CgeB
MGHTVVEADMSPLYPFYQYYRQAGLPEARQDDVGRQLIRFVGEYLTFVAEAERPDLLLALAQAPLDRRTLNRIIALGIKTAFWFVEDYRTFGYFREVATTYDVFFHIQGRAMEDELQRLGVRQFFYLPLAADPDWFRRITDADLLAPYKTDLSFMGAGYPNRRAAFSRLLDYDFKIWGTDWDLTTDVGRRVQDRGRRIPTQETVLIYNAAKINLNLHSSVFTAGIDSQGGFINPRTFEIAACGAFQLVDQRDPLSSHFHIGKDLAAFTDLADLRRSIDFYLQADERREEMAALARARVLAEHTYRHRMETLLEAVAKTNR